MQAVLTGDIIGSKKTSPDKWLPTMKRVLNRFGGEPGDWEIFRGDSFQIEVEAKDGLRVLLSVKAAICSIQNLDIRLALGIGSKGEKGNKVSERMGEAFIRSGEALDTMGSKGHKFAFSSGSELLDMEMRVMFGFLHVITEKWTRVSAETIDIWLQNQSLSQLELARKLHISQPSVSARLSVAHADEINAFMEYYPKRIALLE